LGISDALYGRAAIGARLAVSTVHGHTFSKGGDLFGKIVPRLARKSIGPLEQRAARRLEEPGDFLAGHRAGHAHGR
jgi:hypothetical protein